MSLRQFEKLETNGSYTNPRFAFQSWIHYSRMNFGNVCPSSSFSEKTMGRRGPRRRSTKYSESHPKQTREGDTIFFSFSVHIASSSSSTSSPSSSVTASEIISISQLEVVPISSLITIHNPSPLYLRIQHVPNKCTYQDIHFCDEQNHRFFSSFRCESWRKDSCTWFSFCDVRFIDET